MEYARFTYFSVNSISIVLLLGVVLAYFLSRRNKTAAGWLITGFFGGVMVTFMYLSWVYCTLRRAGPAFEYLHFIALCASSVCLLQIPYYFPGPSRKLESRIVLAISIALHVYALAYVKSAYQDFPVQNFENHSMVYSIVRIENVNLVLVLDYVAAMVLFIRKTFEVSGHEGAGEGAASSRMKGPGGPVRCLFRAVAGTALKFITPRTDAGAAYRNMSVLLLFSLAIMIILSLANRGDVKYSTFSLATNIGILLIVTLFVITYINRSGERTRFMTKIIGISFVFLLAVISNIGYITLGQKERSYDELRLAETFYARRCIAAERPFDIAGTALAVISCPMDNDPSRPEDFSVVYMRPGGPDLKAYLEDEARHRSEIRKHQSEKNLALYLLGWGRHASAAVAGAFAGRTKYSYTGIYREYPERYVLYDFVHKNKLFRVAFSYLEYRNYMHASASVFIWIVLISSAAVIAGFPLVFHVNLTRPLNALLAGVRKINEGDMSSAVPVKFEDEIGFLTRSFNRMAESIREHTNLLEFRVRERTAEVERLNGLKNRFLAIIAHDLKSPLKTLDFSIDSLVKGKKKGPSGDENIDTIKRTVDYMFRLLDDLSDIAMIESGRLDLQYTENDYGPFLLENIMAKKFAADRKNIEIAAEIPPGLPKMFFDRNRINQVLDNLIENAIRYSDENTKITVTVEPLAKSVITRVIDRGRGIPEDDLGAIFEEYGTSGSGRKPSEKSTGLGLAIAKKIISAHHGDIGVESRVGEGSVFYFTLPVYEV